MNYPVVSTCYKAIDKGYFDGWNGLASKRSATSVTAAPDPMEEPQQMPLNYKSNMVFMTMIDIQGQLFTDQMGRFPLTFNRDNTYVINSISLMQTTSSPPPSNYTTEMNSRKTTMMCVHTSTCKDINHSYINLTLVFT
ncbi:hypothetical protein ACHAW6_011438 [Cyclotella cf. meneghiniana]